MVKSKLLINRRSLLLGVAAAGLSRIHADAAETQPSDLVAAATREGNVTFYTALDAGVAQKIGAAFTARYPGIHVRVERAGAELLMQRVMQEYGSNIHSVDVVETSDITSMVVWKGRGWLAKSVPDEVVKLWPARERDPDLRFATVRAHLAVISYNTRQVKADEAPKSFKDLLDPKWRMRMVKANPSYSGAILSSTLVMSKALGWSYFEKLATQRVMQVQAAIDAAKKTAQGERSIGIDGSDYAVFFLQASGNPIEIVYPEEGTPMVSGQAAVLEQAPHPNAARLFSSYLFSAEGQQLLSDVGGLRTFHPNVKLKPGRKPLSQIKILEADPAELIASSDEIKRHYSKIFGV